MDFSDFSEIEECREDNASGGGTERLVFHYSRDERVKRAPELVQKYYSGDFKAFRPGLFRALTATRPNRLILFALVICFAVVAFAGFFGPKKNACVFMGSDVELSAFSYDETVYVSLRFSDADKKHSGDFSDGIPVSAEFKIYGAEDVPVSEHSSVGKYMGKELFIRTTFADYDIVKATADVAILGELFHLEASVVRR